uniref:VASt domain-containing protein n=1 Tax=Graphocephala atropunctata TaxID=36148 RepID=A0A1B6LGC8_9HEMI
MKEASTITSKETFDNESDSQPPNQDSTAKQSERKGGEKSKKKTPWYSALYPTYKTRSEDFKRIFKDLPLEERLVVDYSCAIQRDILIHGRIYASQSFLCFYANIFRWETQVIVKWKDITSITKEKTALVIPNAILIHTNSEKHFLTSFATRDKTYLMLLRIWQHALMDQPMSVQEMWHWVHVCYGDELGLTSDDEDYVPGDTKISSDLSSDKTLEESTQKLRKGVEAKEEEGELSQNMAPHDQDVPTDSSDASEPEFNVRNQSSKESRLDAPVSCPVKHEGRMLLNQVLPVNIDDLFTLIFTYNQFNMNLMDSMKYTDINISNWEEMETTGLKTRVCRLVVPVSQPVGPKTCHVTETQLLQACSKPGELYVIEVEAVNAGVPYCDSFYITTHYCLTRLSATEATFTVHCQIKYRKSVWGLVKGFIEKNVWAGLEDFFKSLGKALGEECSKRQVENGVEVTSSQKRESIKAVTFEPPPEPVVIPTTPTTLITPPATFNNDTVLWIVLGVLGLLVFLNTILYYKLSVLEHFDKESRISPTVDSLMFGEERSHEQWVTLLQKQALQHQQEVHQWKESLKSIVSLLRQAEESIVNLQSNIQTAVSERVVASLNTLSDPESIPMNKKHNEL